jgi:hypothetical protein
MNSASTLPIAFLMALAATSGATSAAAQTNRTNSLLPSYITPVHANTEPQRSMLSGDEIVLATEWQLDANCKSVPLPTIKIRKEPKGGTLSFRESKRTIVTQGLRQTCGAKEIDAVDIIYKARGDFAGADKAEIDIGYQMGITRKAAYAINVRKTPASAKAADIEEAEISARRNVLSGSEIGLGTLRQYALNCEQVSAPVARILKDATGGTLTFRETKHTIKTKNGKSRCEGKVIDAVEVVYKARTDFSGTDEPELEIGWRNGTTRKVKLTIAVRGMKDGAQEAKIDTSIKEQSFKRDVFSGNEIRVAAPNNVKTDCTTGEIADIRIVAAPEHGEIRFDTIKIPVSRPASNSRNGCNGKEVEARAYFYKSSDGYTGDDKFTVDVDFKTGKVERYSYNMRVR